MKLDHEGWPFSMVQLDGPTSMVRFLKKAIYKAFGPLTRCIHRMWTKRNDHAPKSECVDFLIYAQKGQFWKKNLKKNQE